MRFPNQRVIALVALVKVMILGLPACAAEPDAALSILGLKSIYCNSEPLKIEVKNHGSEALSIIVAIEINENGKWTEAWSTLRVQPGQILPKVLVAEEILPKSVKLFTFEISNKVVKQSVRRAKHRLRVDSFLRGKRSKSMTSNEFALCDT